MPEEESRIEKMENDCIGFAVLSFNSVNDSFAVLLVIPNQMKVAQLIASNWSKDYEFSVPVVDYQCALIDAPLEKLPIK